MKLLVILFCFGAWVLGFAFNGFAAARESRNPFDEAQRAFVRALNSMTGIELAGGPFRIAEEHSFEGESGYFVLAPEVLIPTIDQRLSVQTRMIPANLRTNSLPVAASDYVTDGRLGKGDREQIYSVLARNGFANVRDEITVLDLDAIQMRRVAHLPILKIEVAGGTNETAVVLLGAQTWQGIPLYRVSFDRLGRDFELDAFRESFVTRRRHEVAVRAPFLAPQTFFAEPGIARADWQKLLRNFAAIDLPAVAILEATMSERLVTLYADMDRPVVPQQWVKLRKTNGLWQIEEAVEFRAEFPRPGAWWSFLPLLPESRTPLPDRFPESKIPELTRRDIASIVARLRGVGQMTALTARGASIRMRTTHDDWRGYDLEFGKMEGVWRLKLVSEWTR